MPFALLFFGVFGQTKTEQVKIDKANTDIQLRQQPTQTDFLYKILFGIYMLVAIVVLRNLLTAMMSDTYHRIQVHVHVLTLKQTTKSKPTKQKNIQTIFLKIRQKKQTKQSTRQLNSRKFTSYSELFLLFFCSSCQKPLRRDLHKTFVSIDRVFVKLGFISTKTYTLVKNFTFGFLSFYFSFIKSK